MGGINWHSLDIQYPHAIFCFLFWLPGSTHKKTVHVLSARSPTRLQSRQRGIYTRSVAVVNFYVYLIKLCPNG